MFARGTTIDAKMYKQLIGSIKWFIYRVVSMKRSDFVSPQSLLCIPECHGDYNTVDVPCEKLSAMILHSRSEASSRTASSARCFRIDTKSEGTSWYRPSWPSCHNVQISDGRSGPKSAKMLRNVSRMVARS